MRTAPRLLRRPSRSSPGFRTKSVPTCQVLRPRRAEQALALSYLSVLPWMVWKHAEKVASWVCAMLFGIGNPSDQTEREADTASFRGSMAGLQASLSTLRLASRDALRMTRGQGGLLFLYCCGLSPFTLCAVSRRTNVRFFPFREVRPYRVYIGNCGSIPAAARMA
jgi:hypothetical protein